MSLFLIIFYERIRTTEVQTPYLPTSPNGRREKT